MLIIIKKRATEEQLKKTAEDFDGYIKVVVDVKRGILAGGGKRHFEGEQKLLGEGSEQRDLWGGGLDLETREIDCNSVINLRPQHGNPSREILSKEIRERFDKIIRDLLLD